jgi:hypothetical protein
MGGMGLLSILHNYDENDEGLRFVGSHYSPIQYLSRSFGDRWEECEKEYLALSTVVLPVKS